MLVHQSHTETKKGKEKAVTSKSKHDEHCRERETKRETGSVCIYVSKREREKALQDDCAQCKHEMGD